MTKLESYVIKPSLANAKEHKKQTERRGSYFKSYKPSVGEGLGCRKFKLPKK